MRITATQAYKDYCDDMSRINRKERPILFSTPMVQAILAGNKTMTRRVVKPNDLFGAPLCGFKAYQIDDGPNRGKFGFSSDDDDWVCLYGRPGDLLWVREAFSLLDCFEGNIPIHEIDGDNVIYFQECPDFRWVDGDGFTEYTKAGHERSHWKPSIHMPKKYARIWLKVTDVRVERLQSITPEDAEKEGISLSDEELKSANSASKYVPKFRFLWDSLNEQRGHGWDKNPWVWVVEFERVDRPKAAKGKS